MDWPIGFELLPFLLRKIERSRLKRPVTSWLAFIRAHAVLVIILDRLAPVLKRLVGRVVADDEVVFAQMIKQGLEPLLEQRQPVLHPGQSTAFRQRLVERVLSRGRAELLAVARAEALDAVGIEQCL